MSTATEGRLLVAVPRKGGWRRPRSSSWPRGPSLRGGRAGAARALPERAGRPSARAARTTSRSTCRTGSSTSASPARILVAEAQADVVRLADLGLRGARWRRPCPRRSPQQGIRRPRGPAHARRLPRSRHAPRSWSGSRGRAHPGVGIGRGSAAPRSLGGCRRSRLHGLDGERERPAPHRLAALLRGRADLESRGGRDPAQSSSIACS
jgi:hypothetical protein